MAEPLILPVDYLPQYLCAHCQRPLRYDEQLSASTLAHCDACDRHWRVTGLSYQADGNTGRNGGHHITLEAL